MSKRKKIERLEKRVKQLETELAIEKFILEKFPTPKMRQENFMLILTLRS